MSNIWDKHTYTHTHKYVWKIYIMQAFKHILNDIIEEI